MSVIAKAPLRLTIAQWVANLSFRLDSLPGFAELVARQLAEAATQGADILMMPEHISEYWMRFAPQDLPLTAEPEWIAARGVEMLPLLQVAVDKAGIALLAGSFSCFDTETGEYRNRSHMLFPDRPPVFHDKLVMTPFEKDPAAWVLFPGTQLHVFNWRGLRMAHIICLDVEMPHLAHVLAQEDIDVLLVPSMTARPAGYHRVFSCARARAVELFAAVAVVGCVGSGGEANGVPRDGPHHGGAAVYIPAETTLGDTGVFSDMPMHNSDDGVGRMLISHDIPVGKIRAIRHRKAGAPEAWPGAWGAEGLVLRKEK